MLTHDVVCVMCDQVVEDLTLQCQISRVKYHGVDIDTAVIGYLSALSTALIYARARTCVTSIRSHKSL